MKKNEIYMLYFSIGNVLFHSAYTINNNQCFFSLFQQFQKDFIAPYTVTGYSVKILSGDKNSNLLDVDGEMIKLVDGEYEVWYVF